VERAAITLRILPDLPFTAAFRYLWVLVLELQEAP